MDDFARRFDLRPLVPRDALHTGKLALQRVRALSPVGAKGATPDASSSAHARPLDAS